MGDLPSLVCLTPPYLGKILKQELVSSIQELLDHIDPD